MIAGLLVGVWVARYLGPEQFGIFSYVMAFTALFSSIAKLGLDEIVVREIVNHPGKKDVYLGTAFWMKLIGAILTIALIALTLPWTSNDKTTILYIFIISSGLIFQSFEVVSFYFQAQVLAKFISFCKLTQLILSSLIKIYLILTEAELVWFIWIILFDQITLAITYIFVFRCQKLKFPPFSQFNRSTAASLIRDSWPLIFSGIVVMIYMRIDQVMIKEMLSEDDVGIYSAAVRLAEVWYFIPMLLTTSLFPAIVNAKKSSEQLYYKRMQQLYSLMIWSAIGISIITTFISNWLILFLYGDAYKAASDVLAINIWAGIFVFLGVASGKWYLTENLQKLSLINTSIGALFNIILNLYLVPRYEIKGAAVATLISYGIAAYFMNAVHVMTIENFKRITAAFFFKKLNS
jgi:O-antigen/teichoic acid export membrane protein